MSPNWLFVLLLAQLVLSKTYEFTGNVSSSAIVQNGWQYRPTSFQTFDLIAWLGANYESVNINVQNATVDAVTGSAYIAIEDYPFSFLSYFEGSASLNFGLGDGQDFATLDVSAAAGYVGTAYLSLEETTPNGTLVATQSLQWGLTSDYSWSRTDEESSSDSTLNYITFTGEDRGSSTVVNLTFFVSSVAGIVTGNVPIVPKSLESLVSISSYPYQSQANSLSLVLGVGTGGLNFTANDRTVYSGSSSVYFSVSNKATVGGKVQGAKVSGFTAGDVSADVDNSNFESQLTGKYGDSYSFSIVKVTFPPGASSIVYDPSVGSGVSVQAVQSSASSLFVSLLLTIVAVVLVVA